MAGWEDAESWKRGLKEALAAFGGVLNRGTFTSTFLKIFRVYFTFDRELTINPRIVKLMSHWA